MTYTYEELQKVVDRDVRSEASHDESVWLREPENIAVWARELYRLRETVEDQLEMTQSAVDAMPPGKARDAEQAVAKKKSIGRLYYLKHVEKRIAEVESLGGREPLIMVGQVRLVLDAALDALDNGQVRKAVGFLERLQDAVNEDDDEAVA